LLAAMPNSFQQTFLELVYMFIASGAALPDRCSANAALALACVARCGQRLRLQSYAWRCLRACEYDMVRMMEVRALNAEEELQRIAILIRSNTDVRGGSLEERVRRVLGEHGMATHVVDVLQRQAALAETIQHERRRGDFWFGVASLADDVTEPHGDEED
jgi:hypothetical protein